MKYQGDRIRLDRLLADHFQGISRSYLQELILGGSVRVNGQSARKGLEVRAGDEVEIEAFERPEERTIDPNPELPLVIVWQSDDLMVVDKPAGMPTHPNDYMDTSTLANAALARFPRMVEVGDDRLRPGIVHRLDTDTSGLLIVAKTQLAFKELRRQFDERRVEKTYIALVLGEIFEAGEVSLPIAHHPKNPRRMVAIQAGVKSDKRVREARTLYKPIQRFKDYTLLEVQTKTGRMHQVRVHLSAIGHPLVGDRLYQTPQERRKDDLRLKRHFLHATLLRFDIPGTTEKWEGKSELPAELKNLLVELKPSSAERK